MESYNCLIADPNSNYRMILFSCIGQYRTTYFNRIQAADPETTMMKFISDQPDIIFLDLGMPFVGGMSLLEKITTINPNIFVVLMGDVARERDVRLAADKGAKSFLLKPFNTKKIHEILNEFMKLKKLSKDINNLTSISDQTINIVNDFVKTIRLTEKFSKDWDEALKAILTWDVLIVDKNQSNTTGFLNFLQPHVRSVSIANNYEEARTIIAISMPNLLLLDITADDFPGLEFIEKNYSHRLPNLMKPMQIGMVDIKSQMDDQFIERGLVGFMSRQFEELRVKKALLKSYVTSVQEKIDFQRSELKKMTRY